VSATERRLPQNHEEAIDDILELREEIFALRRVVEPARAWTRIHLAQRALVPPPRSTTLEVTEKLTAAVVVYEQALAKKQNGGR
jgi:hypothetical protein